MPIRSFTAARIRCFEPRYLSVVWTDKWPRSSWICSSSPPALWHKRAHERRLCRVRHRRRTCAKLCRKSGGDLQQIRFLLGHASIATTERYLGAEQELSVAVNDNLDL
jgi:integrase